MSWRRMTSLRFILRLPVRVMSCEPTCTWNFTLDVMNLAVCWLSSTLLSVSCNSMLRGATGASATVLWDLHEAKKANGNAMSATLIKWMVFILFLFFMLNSLFFIFSYVFPLACLACQERVVGRLLEGI